MRDRLLPYDEKISRLVTCPIAMGALRRDPSSWADDAIYYHSNGYRPVLSGGLHDLELLEKGIRYAQEFRPQIRFALFTHWSELLRNEIPDSVREQLDEIYVAIDSMPSIAEAQAIRARYRPKWVLIPRLGLNWKKLITECLLPNKRGSVTLLAPEPNSPDGPYLSSDELLLNIQELQIDHPLIEIRPAQHEWFLPTELKPWRMHARDRRSVQLILGGPDRSTFTSAGLSTVSFIVPFHWKGDEASLDHLRRNLESCLRTTDQIYSMAETISTEFIVVLDRAPAVSELSVEDFVQSLDPRIAQGLTWLEAPRFTMAADWRAGWIRNVGAEYSRAGSGSYLVFLDADCEIADTRQVASEIVNARYSLIYTSLVDLKRKDLSSQETAPFQVCSSRLLIIRRSLFENLGGFSEAFEEYGCEDNFLVWQASEFIRRGLPLMMVALPLEATHHLRAISEDDDLLEKMIRIRRSAGLCYRMSLDPRVHRHFFVSLGRADVTRDLYPRFLLKRFATRIGLRWFLGPLVFLLTVLQTQDLPKYLRGIWDSFIWFIRAPLIRVSSQSWRFGMLKHGWREHAWKIPHAALWPARKTQALFGKAKVASEKTLISAKSSDWGWKVVGWRLKLAVQRFSIWCHRLYGESKRVAALLLSAINRGFTYPLIHLFKQIPWLLKVCFLRVTGVTKRLGSKWIIVPALQVVTFPYHFLREHGWRLKQALLFPFRLLASNLWRVRVFAEWLWGQRWRISVTWRRLQARLWFIPVGIERARKKLGLSKHEGERE